MANPTAVQQLMLELINRTRLDPDGEAGHLMPNGVGASSEIRQAVSYFGVSAERFATQMAAYDPQAPLAWNDRLTAAAQKHSAYLADTGQQTHTGRGGSSAGDRISAEGYSWRSYAENVYSYADTPLHAHAGFVIDWGWGPGGMQTPAGHRENIMRASVQEVGLGVVENGSMPGQWVVTQEFARTKDYKAQLLGVVIEDTDSDDAYDIGEGMGGVRVTATGAGGSFSTTTWASGGYQLALDPGSYRVTFSGGGLDGEVSRNILFGNENLKLDAEADQAVRPVIPDTGGNNVLRGSVRDDVLRGTAGDDMILGLDGADRLIGAGGDDWLIGDGQDPGFDAAAATVYRLYQAALGRIPEARGLMAWADRLEQGDNPLDIARGFAGSAEFRQLHDAGSAADFVNRLYDNVLGRAPDAAGLAAWVARLDAGASRAEVVTGFAGSAEFTLRTEVAVLDWSRAGLQSAWSDDVYQLYQATLGRAPGPAGHETWTNYLANGRDYLSVVEGFTGSAEFQRRYGATDSGEFVTLLYENVLDRAPNAAGLAAWTAQLQGGASRAEIVQGFAQSDEFSGRSEAALRAWMQASAGDGDRLEAGKGDTVMFGGYGADTFVFERADTGRHQVAGVEDWDRVDLSDFGYAGTSSALARLTQTGADTVFSDRGVVVVFEDTARADLDADMFLL